MSKSADAFRTISEVADWLGVQAHVLRFWESKFTQIKPVKRAGGRRYYRPADMLLLGGIRKLLHKDGLSIKEVQTILRDQGIAHVSQLSHELDSDSPPAENASIAPLPKTTRAEEQVSQKSPAPSPSETNDSVLDSAPVEDDTSKAQRPPGLSVKRSGNANQTHTVASAPASPAEAPLEPMESQSAKAPGPSFAAVENESAATTLPPAEQQDAIESEISEPISSASESEPQAPAVAETAREEVRDAPSGPESVPPEPEQMHMELESPAEFDQAVPPPSLQIETEAEAPSAHASPAADLLPTLEQEPPELTETMPQELASGEPGAGSGAVELANPENHSMLSAEASAAEVIADENGQEADPTSAEAEAPQAVPVPQPTAPRYEPSTTTANVLSLLSTTTHLPAHLKADVAGCAAELRAILNAG